MITPEQLEWLRQNQEEAYFDTRILIPAILIMFICMALYPLVCDFIGLFSSNKTKDPDYITRLDL